MVLKPFNHFFGSCSPAKGMVYELSETDRVAMVCSVLQPCVAAMCILIEQDQHIEPIPDFCHLCQFSGMKVDTNVTFREWPCLMEMTTLSSWSKSEKDCSMLLYISWEQH